MKKRTLLLFLCFAMLMTCSCSNAEYTRESPYIVDLNGFALPESITLENNTDVYDKRDIDEFLDFYYEGKLMGYDNAILIVEPLSSTSYYWNQEGDKGGYTITELKVEMILEKGGSWDEESVAVGDVLNSVQLFTVQPNGKVVFPKYQYVDCINEKYISTQYSRKIPEMGKKYICFYSNDFLITADNHYGSVINPGPDVGKFLCYYPKAFGKQGEACVLNKSGDEYSVSYKRFCRVYEFSEEAYEASKKIVEEYKSEGKNINDGSYYHYHGMVVDGWERYSKSVNGETDT